MYRVMILPNGSYKAVPVATDGTPDTFGSFEVQDWHVFTRELKHRLTHEKQASNPRGYPSAE